MQRTKDEASDRTRASVAAWLVLTAICMAMPVQAQRVQSDETFEDEVSVLEVETAVQVFVDGTPVRGLTRDDFRVVYRDRELDIVSFEAVDLSTESGNADLSETASEEIVEQIAVPRSILLLFDFQYTPRGLMGRSIRTATEMVEGQLHPADRVAVAVMGGRKGAQLLTGFTRDRDRTRLALDLVDAIADAKGRRQRELVAQLTETAPSTDRAIASEYGVAASVAFGDGLQDVTISANPSVTVNADVDLAGVADGGNPLGAGAAEVFAIGQRLANYDNYRLAEQYAEAFGNLGTLLSGIEGQKYALLFSQGPPLSLLEMTTVSSGGGNSGTELANTNAAEGSAMVQEAFTDAFAQLVRAGWQIHAMSQGLRPAAIPGASGSIDDYGGGPGVAAAGAPRNDGGGLVFLMADETGGRAYLNRGFPPVEEFLQQTAVSYVLRFVVEGFESGATSKERYRVELADASRNPRAELDYRDFFYPPKPRRKMNQVEQRIADAENQLRDQAERASRNFEFTALSFTDPQDPGAAWLAVHFPASQLRRSAQAARLGAGDSARLEVVASLGVDPQTGFDRVALNQSLTVPAMGMNNPPPDGMTFVGRLDPGNGFIEGGEVVRVAVELGVTGARLRLRLQDWAPSDEASGVVGPFFLPAGLERLILRDSSNGDPVELPLKAPNGAELVPMPFAEVQADEQLGVMFWSQDDGGSVLGPDTESFAARAVRLDGDGAVTALQVERRGQIGANVLWYTSLRPEGLPAGVYRIETDGFDNGSVGYFRVLGR